MGLPRTKSSKSADLYPAIYGLSERQIITSIHFLRKLANAELKIKNNDQKMAGMINAGVAN
jgi:hypothetical protein